MKLPRFPAILALFWGLVLLAAGPTASKVAGVNATNRTETATIGGGCFWCLEAVFERLPGVDSVVSGYAGGRTENPSYREVCNSDTGHAEVIQIEFNPAVVTFEKLLEVFWEAHDPTTINQQGADVGSQYRSIILTHSPGQAAAAEKSRAGVNTARFGGRVTTQIVALKKFYRAEESHQHYFQKHPNQPYCQAVISPKLFKLEKHGTVPPR